MEFGQILLPTFDVPTTHSPESYLHERCVEGLKERYGDPLPEEVRERLDTELEVINGKGFAAYFLIVSDFVSWAKENGIRVGPGRGSAAGSIISYSLGITSLDPIGNGLLFERFLNPERTEMPDIDIDFDDERRGDVIEYVRGKYGADHVAQIVTFGTMKARAAVRDAGRVLGYPYGIPDKISKMIGSELDATIDSSIAGNTEFRQDYAQNADTKRIVDAARAIEGITRNEGVHAAGVVICPRPLHEYIPVKKDTKGQIITQYDGPTVADLGLLKMDFLGLRNLTVIADAVKQIEANHGVRIDPDDIPLDDPDTFKLLQRGDTAGVFQVESAGMRQLLKELKPTAYADIVAVLALYRPGPLGSGMVKDFVERKNGKKPVSYYDERLKPILEETYGAIVYQEQVMRIAMTMSGFSAAEADKLRKAMGKKLLDKLVPLEKHWVEGAAGQRVRPQAGAEAVGRHPALRGVRLQQEPLGGLRPDHDADRLPEGALPARVHGRGAHQLHRQDRFDREVRGRVQPRRHERPAARRELVAARLHRGGGRHPFRPRGHPRRGSGRRRGHRAGARGGRTVHVAQGLLRQGGPLGR